MGDMNRNISQNRIAILAVSQYVKNRNNIESWPKYRNTIESSHFCQFPPLTHTHIHTHTHTLLCLCLTHTHTHTCARTNTHTHVHTHTHTRTHTHTHTERDTHLGHNTVTDIYIAFCT